MGAYKSRFTGPQMDEVFGDHPVLRAEVEELEQKVATYSISKQGIPEDGYACTYVLTKDGVPEGDKINIPKDMVVESGDVKTCIEDDKPVTGYKVGDKYIDLVLANSKNTHLYILVTDLVDTYLQGDGISINNNVISANATIARRNDLMSYSMENPVNGITIQLSGTLSSPIVNITCDKVTYAKYAEYLGQYTADEYLLKEEVKGTEQDMKDILEQI